MGRLPRYEEYDRRRCLNSINSDGTSLTIIIPKESGPNACSRVENDTFPKRVRSAFDIEG